MKMTSYINIQQLIYSSKVTDGWSSYKQYVQISLLDSPGQAYQKHKLHPKQPHFNKYHQTLQPDQGDSN
jgi:hypothetical protein